MTTGLTMAANGGLTSSFIYELMTGIHDLSADTLKCALFVYDTTPTPTNAFSSETTAYAATNEASGSGYSAGGIVLTGLSLTQVGAGWGLHQSADITFSTVSVSADQALIYNASKANRSVAWVRFGATRSSTAQDFKIKRDMINPYLIRLEP